MSRAKLEAAIRRLLGCPALNLDDLEDEDRAAIEESRSLIDQQPVAAAAAHHDVAPGDPTEIRRALPRLRGARRLEVSDLAAGVVPRGGRAGGRRRSVLQPH